MDELKMTISGVITKDDKKCACVHFESEASFAEGYIPDCKIEKSEGFSEEEIEMLEDYMKDNLETIKRYAADVDPIRSMMKE